MSVDITFRADGAWGSGKGSDLTPAEVDGNFYALQVAVEYIQDNPVAPHQIVNVTQSGGDATFWLDDSTTFTVTLPVVTYRGAPVGSDVEGIGVTDGGTFAPALADLGKWFTCVDGDLSVLIEDVEADAPIGAELHFYSQVATGGLVTIEESTDVALEFKVGRLAAVDAGGVMTVKKRAAGIWVVFGDLAEDVST